MKEGIFVIKNSKGLHATPAALFVQTASRFKCGIKVSKEGMEVNGKSIMGLMLLAAGRGSRIKIVASGPDESEAVASLGRLVSTGFAEP